MQTPCQNNRDTLSSRRTRIGTATRQSLIKDVDTVKLNTSRLLCYRVIIDLPSGSPSSRIRGSASTRALAEDRHPAARATTATNKARTILQRQQIRNKRFVCEQLKKRNVTSLRETMLFGANVTMLLVSVLKRSLYIPDNWCA